MDLLAVESLSAPRAAVPGPGCDALGWRRKFGVVAPSTNTIVQPDYERLRVDGVTNHHSRVVIPDDPVTSDDDFLALMARVRGATLQAIDAVMTCHPDYLVMGMSAETFWDGVEGAETLRRTVEERTGIGVALGSHASLAAIACYGPAKRLGIITPYMPAGDAQVRQFFDQSGHTVAALVGLKCPSPVAIAHVDVATLSRAIDTVNDPAVDLILQVGTNLSMLTLAAQAEQRLGKPVVAINAATYWYALRRNGIDQRFQGLGSLLAEH